MKSSDAHGGCASLHINESGPVGYPTEWEWATALLSWLCPHLWKGTPHTTVQKELMATKTLERCSQLRLVGKNRTKGATTWLAIDSTVLVPQAIERRCGTINKFVWGWHGKRIWYRVIRPTSSWLHPTDCATTQKGWEVTVNTTVPGNKVELHQRRAGGRPLRWKFRARYENICCLDIFNRLEVEGRDLFKITCSSNNLWTTLGSFRF